MYKDPEKQREWQRNHARKRREKYFNGKTCNQCSSRNNLELHHINPDAKKDHRIWSWSIPRIEEELKKCVILCRTCHQLHHNPPTAKCGSDSKYKRGCRCRPCKDAHAIVNRRYR